MKKDFNIQDWLFHFVLSRIFYERRPSYIKTEKGNLHNFYFGENLDSLKIIVLKHSSLSTEKEWGQEPKTKGMIS